MLKIYSAELRNGIDGPLVSYFGASDGSQGATSVLSSETGETWTIYGTGSYLFFYSILPVTSGTPRSYYDPTTLEYRGYLAEGARTNLCLRSEQFDNAAWGKTNVAVSPNSIVSPDGTTTADTLTDDSVSGLHQTGSSGITFAAATAYSFSVYAKAGTAGWIQLRLDAVPFAVNCFANFNVSTGVVGTVGAGATSGSIQALPNGWYRCTLQATSGAGGGLYRCFINLTNNTNSAGAPVYVGSGQNVYLWGAQLEAASFASSYIPTTASAVTRNADVLTYPAAGNALNTGGTLYCEAGPSPGANINPGYLIDVENTGSNDWGICNINANLRALMFSGGANQGSANTVAWTNGTSGKGAATFGTDIIQQAWNGTAATADTSATVPVSVSNIRIGCNANGLAQPFMPIRNVRIWTRQFSSAQLQQATA